MHEEAAEVNAERMARKAEQSNPQAALGTSGSALGGNCSNISFPELPAAVQFDAREVRRKIWHMLPGLLPFVFIMIPHRDPLDWVALCGILVFSAILLVYAFAVQRSIRRDGEQDFPSAVLGYALPSLTMIVLFPAQTELGLALATVIAFGDASATIAGLTLPRRPLPWNQEKTWAGLIAFIVCAIPPATLAYWGEARPTVSIVSALIVAAAASIVAAFSESLRVRLNDNIRVGIGGSLTLIVVQTFLVGW